jgi:hypothetical protein
MRSLVPLLVALLLCLALPPRCEAQALSYSLRIGIAGTTLSGDSDADFEPRTSLAGGFGIGYNFGNGLVMMPELMYVTKGAHFDATTSDLTGADVPVRARYDLTYIEIPLLLSYRFGRGDVRPFVTAGPSVAYNVSAQLNLRARGEEAISQSFTDNTIETVDYGLVVGGGAEVLIRGERVVFEARLTLGQSDVRDREPALTNRSLLVLAGFAF